MGTCSYSAGRNVQFVKNERVCTSSNRIALRFAVDTHILRNPSGCVQLLRPREQAGRNQPKKKFGLLCNFMHMT